MGVSQGLFKILLWRHKGLGLRELSNHGSFGNVYRSLFWTEIYLYGFVGHSSDIIVTGLTLEDYKP